jgi:hypothetical protein
MGDQNEYDWETANGLPRPLLTTSPSNPASDGIEGGDVEPGGEPLKIPEAAEIDPFA